MVFSIHILVNFIETKYHSNYLNFRPNSDQAAHLIDFSIFRDHPGARRSCPPDQEIILHWADRPDTPAISTENHNTLTREIPKFSFDIPALAVPVRLEN